MKKNISIIGLGNLGLSLFKGIQKTNANLYNKIYLTKRNTDSIRHLASSNVIITDNNKDSVQNSSIVIVCVKPHQMKNVLNDIREVISEKTLIISTITGKTSHDIGEYLNKKNIVVRAMPNTASSVGESVTCINNNTHYTDENIQDIKELFQCIGKILFIEESLMDSATVLGACGIAYALRFIRAMIQGGIEIGFDAKTATDIATQTVKGASCLLSEYNLHPEQEIDKVTTPQGCTIKGLNEMEHNGFSSSLMKGILASFKQIK